jgi:seryl-tRNA synthetase
MIDLKTLRENPDLVRAAIKNRGDKIDLEEIIQLDVKRRQVITRIDNLRKDRNDISAQYPARVSAGRAWQRIQCRCPGSERTAEI